MPAVSPLTKGTLDPAAGRRHSICGDIAPATKKRRGKAKAKVTKPDTTVPAPLSHSVVDYGKWDHLSVSLFSSDDDEDGTKTCPESQYSSLPPDPFCDCRECTYKRARAESAASEEDGDEEKEWSGAPSQEPRAPPPTPVTPAFRLPAPAAREGVPTGSSRPAKVNQEKSPAVKHSAAAPLEKARSSGIMRGFLSSGSTTSRPKSAETGKELKGVEGCTNNASSAARGQTGSSKNPYFPSDDDDEDDISLCTLVTDESSRDIDDISEPAGSEGTASSNEAVDIPYTRRVPTADGQPSDLLTPDQPLLKSFTFIDGTQMFKEAEAEAKAEAKAILTARQKSKEAASQGTHSKQASRTSAPKGVPNDEQNLKWQDFKEISKSMGCNLDKMPPHMQNDVMELTKQLMESEHDSEMLRPEASPASVFAARLSDKNSSASHNSSLPNVLQGLAAGLEEISEASAQPWPGVQAQEEPVRKYAYSVRNGVITEEVAQKLRNGTFKASDVSEPKNTGKAKFKDSGKTEVSKAKNTAKTSQSSASSTSKRKDEDARGNLGTAKVEYLGSAVKDAKEADKSSGKDFMKYLQQARYAPNQEQHRVAEENFQALLEEEERQKEEEKKRQEDKDEAKRNKRKQKQQKKKERLKANHDPADAHQPSASPRESERAQNGASAEGSSAPASAINARGGLDLGSQTEGMDAPKVATEVKKLPELEESLEAKLRRLGTARRERLKAQQEAAEAATPASDTTPPAPADQAQAQALSKATAALLPRPERHDGAGPSMRDVPQPLEPATPRSEFSGESPVALHEEAGIAGEDSNPFSVLLGAQALPSEKRSAGPNQASASSMRAKIRELAQRKGDKQGQDQEEAEPELPKMSIQQQWEKQPMPNPSGFAAGPVIAQAKAAWTGLEEAIDTTEPAVLSEAIIKVEEWLLTHSKSKVFAILNAEIKIRAEQAKQILKTRHGISEPSTLVRPAPHTNATPPQRSQHPGVPLRPVPLRPQGGQPGRRPQPIGPMWRGGRHQQPYGGRGRGPPPPAAFIGAGPQEPAGPPQWESTSIADLDPFGGVPNRGAVNGVSHAVNLPVRNLEPRPHGGYNRPYPSGGRGRDMRASYDAMHFQGSRPPPARPTRPLPPVPSARPAVPMETRPLPMPHRPLPPSESHRPLHATRPASLANVKRSGAQQHEEDEEGQTCVICMEWPPEIILQPCGHNNMCENCAISVKNLNEGLCPTCRCKIEAIIRPR